MKTKEHYSGKNAIVTGAASGIGLALIEELLSLGAAKTLLADFSRENLEKAVARLSEEYPGRVRGVVCDVTKENEVAAMIAEAAEFFGGRIELLVNNAGKGFAGFFAESSCDMERAGRLLDIRIQSNDDWENAFALNFYGALYGCRAVIPYMLKAGGGEVVNIISGVAFSPMPLQTMYAATKAALMALTLSLRAEYWEENIRFIPATPGTTATSIWRRGDGEDLTPPAAQSPRESAARILAGAAANRRIICGDDGDAEGLRLFGLAEAAEALDKYFANVAKERKNGSLAI
ncbi:MAG: SDR family oxidoreductase [Synergistaceae bacterium]|nr:SDR family oxidoreductase [Synergistaceae bacterium]